MTSTQTVRLERFTTDRPWGFTLQGGRDYSLPLSIESVNPNTLAHTNGLNTGDQIISINGRDVTNVTQQEAKMEITRTGNELELTVIKGAIKPNTIMHTKQTQSRKPINNDNNHSRAPINATTHYQIIQTNSSQPTIQKHENPQHIQMQVSNFESSPAFNRNPLQREVWRPKTYRQDSNDSSRLIGTAVYHAQYNSPIGLYSDDKVLEAFKSQTGSLIDEIKGNHNIQLNESNNDNQHPLTPTYQAVMNSQQERNIPYSSEAKLSRSFRALEQDLCSVEGTSRAPKSIFNQRRQQY